TEVAVDDVHLRVLAQVASGGGDGTGHEIAVVGVLVGEDLAVSKAEAAPDRIVHAAVGPAHPHHARRVAQQIEGAVAGASVHDHVLHTRVVLTADAFQRLGQEPGPVENRGDDGDEGRFGRGHGREGHTTSDIIGATGA